MRESLSHRLTSALDSLLRFFWPDADPSFPAWLYAVTDFQWFFVLQALIFLLLYIRGWRTRKRLDLVQHHQQELWREIRAQSVDIQMRIERLRKQLKRESP